MDIRIRTTVDVEPDDDMTSEQKVALMEFCVGEMNVKELRTWFLQSRYQRNILDAAK